MPSIRASPLNGVSQTASMIIPARVRIHRAFAGIQSTKQFASYVTELEEASFPLDEDLLVKELDEASFVLDEDSLVRELEESSASLEEEFSSVSPYSSKSSEAVAELSSSPQETSSNVRNIKK